MYIPLVGKTIKTANTRSTNKRQKVLTDEVGEVPTNEFLQQSAKDCIDRLNDHKITSAVLVYMDLED